MTVKELSEKLQLKILTGEASLKKPITGCYCGDLLSWVMSRAESGCAWLTVMGNINCTAVASLTDAACVILTEGAALDEDAEKKAELMDIAILATDKTTYDTAVLISKLI